MQEEGSKDAAGDRIAHDLINGAGYGGCVNDWEGRILPGTGSRMRLIMGLVMSGA